MIDHFNFVIDSKEDKPIHKYVQRNYWMTKRAKRYRKELVRLQAAIKRRNEKIMELEAELHIFYMNN